MDRADGRFQRVVLLEVLCLLDGRTLGGFLPRFNFKMCVRLAQQVNVHYIMQLICCELVWNLSKSQAVSKIPN